MNRKPRQTPHLPGSQIFYVILHFFTVYSIVGLSSELDLLLTLQRSRESSCRALRPQGFWSSGVRLPGADSDSKHEGCGVGFRVAFKLTRLPVVPIAVLCGFNVACFGSYKVTQKTNYNGYFRVKRVDPYGATALH